jgi:hypothetical protein
MNTMTMSHRSRALLIKCLGLSLAVHTALVTFFYFHPLILQGPFKSLFGMTVATPTLLSADEENAELLQKKNHLLEEVFEQVVVLSPHFQQPYDLIELPNGIALAPNEEITPIPTSLDTSLPGPMIPGREFALASANELQNYEENNLPILFTPEDAGPPIASQLQIDPQPTISQIPLIAIPMGPGAFEDLVAISDFSLNATFETDYSLNLSLQLASPNSLKIGEDLQLKTDLKSQAAQVTARDLNLENEKVRSTLFIPKSAPAFLEKKEVAVASSIAELDQYDFPTMAMAAEWNNDFDVDVVFLPNPESKGYIFSVSVQPNYDFSSHSLKQNLYFILDRSNSVQKHRFAVFKRAVLKALASMQHGDTFNIFVIDKKIVSFSPESRPVSMKNIQAAEQFLDKQEAGGLFAAAEIYSSLEKILSSIPESEDIHTAILLTDGKSSLNHQRKQATLKKWVEKNNGKLALYAAAVGRDNDLLSLDMLCSISGGKLLYSDTHASFPRKLSKLVLDLKDPIAKDLMITAIPHNAHSHIEFYPASSHLPSLYSHQPYVLIGQIDEPCAFDLVIQGRHRDEWIAIKKNISFVEGQKGTQALEMGWSAQHANLCYDKFLKEGKPTHLKEAKEILKKSRREIAFE